MQNRCSRRTSSPKNGGRKKGNDELPPQEARVVATFDRVTSLVAYVRTTALIQSYVTMSLQSDEISAGKGSGFVWDDGGHVITYYHVVSSAAGRTGGNVKVKCHNIAEARNAAIVGVDPERDLDVLRMSHAMGKTAPRRRPCRP